MFSRLYQTVLGLPFVYEHIRPWVVGGVDYSFAWRDLDVQPDDVVVDVGCGTGDGLKHVSHFRSYYGFDLDSGAIAYARKRWASRTNAQFEDRRLVLADLERIKPQRVMLGSLLHHMSDADALELFAMLQRVPSIKRVTTVDITPLPGETLNNFFVMLDRGRYPRTLDGYAALAEQRGFQVVNRLLHPIHPTKGRMTCALMGLELKAQA